MLEMLGITEVARKFNIPVHALRRWIATGEIPACKTGRRFLICVANVEAFLRTGNNQPAEPEAPGGIRRLK